MKPLLHPSLLGGAVICIGRLEGLRNGTLLPLIGHALILLLAVLNRTCQGIVTMAATRTAIASICTCHIVENQIGEGLWAIHDVIGAAR